jgi:TPR repeat protein
MNARDYATAIKILRNFAAQGDARALVDLGYMYADGTGVVQNYEEARLFWLGCGAGGDCAVQSWGVLPRGDGVAQDQKKQRDCMAWQRRRLCDGAI